jgi:hypothetical protein
MCLAGSVHGAEGVDGLLRDKMYPNQALRLW